LALIGSSKSIYDILFDIKKEGEDGLPATTLAPVQLDENNMTQHTTGGNL
jgi:hypothetical protein